MAKIEFPVHLVHEKNKGADGKPATTVATTRSSLKVLEARGWKRETTKPVSSNPSS